MKKTGRKLNIFLIWIIIFVFGTVKSAGCRLIPFFENGQWGYFNTRGKVKIKPQFDFAFPIVNGAARVRFNHLWGFVSEKGMSLVPRFTEERDFSGNLAAVRLKKWGIINKNGVLVEPAVFDEVGDLINGRMWVRFGERYGYLDTAGRMVISTNFLYGTDFRDGLAVVQTKTKDQYGFDKTVEGYISKKGRYYFPPVYSEARLFKDSRAAVKMSEGWLLIDQKVRPVTNIYFDAIGDFYGGLARFKQNGYWGFIDKQGRVKIKAFYDQVADFRNGLALYRKRSLWGLLNKMGREITAPIFEKITPFEGKAAVAIKDGYYGVLRSDGRFYSSTNISFIAPFYNGLARFLIGGRWGFLNKRGRVVFKPRYLAVSDFHDGIARVLRQRKSVFSMEFINKKGGRIFRTSVNCARPFRKKDILHVMAYPGLDLKKKPDLDSDTIYRIPYAESVVVEHAALIKKELVQADGMLGYWIQVNYKGSKGYLFDAYLSKYPAPQHGHNFREYAYDHLGTVEWQGKHTAVPSEWFLYGVKLIRGNGNDVYEFYGPDIIEVFVLIKALFGFPEMPLPENYGQRSYNGHSLTIYTQRSFGWKPDSITMTYSGERGNEEVRIQKISPGLIRATHQYSSY